MSEVPTYYGEAINVSRVFIAPVESDAGNTYKVGTPYMLAPVATLAKETSTSTKTRYYSGEPLYVDTSEGDTTVTAVVPGMTVKTRAELLGKSYDTEKGMMYDAGSPGEKYYALGYMVEHAGGFEEYVWLLKGKFSVPREETETKTENINEKTLSVTFTAIVTETQFQLENGKKGGCKAVYADTADEKFTTKESWFDAVVTPPPVAA